MILRQIYIIFLGILLALFVGVGVAAFYQQPSSPTTQPVYPYPASSKSPNPQDEKAYIDQEKANQKKYDLYTQQSKEYSRNVSIISLIASIVFLFISLIILPKVIILTDGFLFGGLFTLIYSIIRGFGSDDSKYRFIVVSIALLIAMYIGYMKFIKVTTNRK